MKTFVFFFAEQILKIDKDLTRIGALNTITLSKNKYFNCFCYNKFR